MLDRNQQSPLSLAGHGQMPATRFDAYPAAGIPYGYGHEIDRLEEPFNPLKLLLLALQYRFLLLTLLVVGLLGGVMFTLMQTPRYQATARVEIMLPSAKVIQDLEVVAESTDVRSFLTAREKFKSRALAQRVAFQLGLTERADFLFPKPAFSVLNLVARAFGSSRAPVLADTTPEQREQLAIGRLLGDLSVDLVPNTSLLAITYRDQNRTYAAEIANQFAQSFIDQRVDQTSATSDLTRQFIQDQVLQVKEKLQNAEKELVEYAKTQGITSTGDDNSLISNNIKELNTALSAAIQEKLDAGRLVQQIDAGRGPYLEPVLQSTGLNTLRGSLAERKSEYQQKLGMFKAGFPEMQQLQGQIREIQRQVDQGIMAITESIRIKYQEGAAKEADLRAKLAELEKENVAYQDKNIQYTILKREVDSQRTQYDSLIGKLNGLESGLSLERRTPLLSMPPPRQARLFHPGCRSIWLLRWRWRSRLGQRSSISLSL